MSNTASSVERTEGIQGEARHHTEGNSHTAFVPVTQLEEMIQQRLREERTRLEQEAGIEEASHAHFRRPEERPFTKAQRPHTTVLFGGLTWKHERILQGSIAGLGYKVMPLANADKQSFQIGKEYGNNGQCNPTYFTVGNLVKYLQSLEAQGLTKRSIIDNYVYVTAGACGPCRFGMYEAEYRLALRNAGFDGFRVMLFQQAGGLSQPDCAAGLEMNLDFFLGILNALNCGDILNELAYIVRPYETTPGQADETLDRAMDYMHEVFRTKKPWKIEDKLPGFLSGFSDSAEYIGKFLNQLTADDFTASLHRCRDMFDEVEVDRLRVKPIVKVTGEFWAQTTEGDGNFNMFRFLEREGAEVLVEPIGTWISYLLHQIRSRTLDARGLDGGPLTFYQKLFKLKAGQLMLTREFERARQALGGTAHALACQKHLERV